MNDTEVSQINRRQLLAGAGAAGLLAGTALLGLSPAQAVPIADGVTKFEPPTDGGSVRALITGDAGTGTNTQWAVANAAREFHAREPFDLAVGLGDNIYNFGPTDDHDAQFANKFENPNAGLDFPWAMVLGNHDTSSVFPGDGGWLERGNFEVAYHATSPRWWMPSRYYSVPVPARNPVVEFFILDLNPLAAYIPPILNPYWAVDGPYMTEQRAWLDGALAASTAQWKVVCTHHPYLNNGPHGSAGSYDGIPIEPINGVHAKAFFEEHVVGKANFIMSGHDHSMQVLEPTAASKGTRQIISGAAAKTVAGQPSTNRADGHPMAFGTFHQLGFMVMDLTPGSVHLRVITVDPATSVGTVGFEQRLV